MPLTDDELWEAYRKWVGGAAWRSMYEEGNLFEELREVEASQERGEEAIEWWGGWGKFGRQGRELEEGVRQLRELMGVNDE